MKMATKLKPQEPRFKRLEFGTKVAKVTKPQGSFWQFTQVFNEKNIFMLFVIKVYTNLL
ncbi:hypothetical protein Hanom_Chr06g00477141 [Helianthus anomalus]